LYDIFPMGDRIGLPFLNAEPICATAQLNLPGTGCYHVAVVATGTTVASPP
jgi:hypothetical protein